MMVSWFIKVNRCISVASILSFVLLIMLSGLTIIPLAFHQEYTEAASGTATESTLSLDITNSIASVDLAVASASGTFASSDASSSASFSVTTNNYTGYTLSISASDNTGELVNGEESLDTISSSLTTSQFDVSANNGKWGYKPSKYRSGNTTVDNTGSSAVYLTSPTTSGTTLDVTTTSNNNANSYTIALGARADYSKEAGTYTKTFTLTAVGNPINYSVTYNKNTEDIVTNMPYSGNNNTQSGDTSNTSITLSNLVPVRDGYTFKGWCSTTTNDETCSGTTYNPDGGGTNLTYGIDKTTVNIANLYAMWQEDILYLQNLNYIKCIGDDITAIDSRDSNDYSIATLDDGACWMTQNLRLGSDGNQVVLTSADSNVTNDFSFTSASAWSDTFTSANVDTAQAYYSGDVSLGSYYNWYTATAGTGNSSTAADVDVSGSICPKGWVLPSSAEYSLLLSQYDNDENKLWTPALPNFVITGYYKDSNFLQGTTHTNAWERTTTSTSNGGAMFMRVGKAAVGSFNKYYGVPVRCRLGGDKTSFTVVYNANGGTGTMSNQTTNTGSITLSSSTFNRSGYEFWGWSTNSDDVAPKYYAGSTIISYVDTLNLYAIWKAGHTITFNMDSNVSSIAVLNSDGTTAGTITASGQSLMLYQGNTYTIKPTYTIGYATNTITKTSGTGTLSGNQFTVNSGSATISITSKLWDGEMQTFNCSLLTNIGDTITVTDSRDNESYLIGKLADNKCWMLDNLRLDLVAHKNDLNSTNTNATDAQLTYLKGTSTGTSSDKWAMSGVAYWTSSNVSYSDPLIAIDNASGGVWNPDTIVTSYGKGSGKIGIYYNYCAASAGTYCWGDGTSYIGSPSSDPKSGTKYDIDGDICPTGWRMPTGGPNGEYDELCTKYNGNTACSYPQTMEATDSGSFQYNLSTPLSGYFAYGIAYDRGNYASIWSSTYDSNISMSDIGAYPTKVYATGVKTRYNGYPVRCLIGS